jgi:precorrin-3B C17-methyltransferase
MSGSLHIVGIGPGSVEHRTSAAVHAIQAADCIVGYKPYVEYVWDLCAGKHLYTTGMRAETERAEYALECARKGMHVAVVATGDACVYGIGGLVMELMSEVDIDSIPVKVVPGITAANMAAAVLGAPLMNDYAVLSLSDLLTDRATVLKRAECMATSGMAMVLYNPASNKRRDLLWLVLDLVSLQRQGETPAGIVVHAGREGQDVIRTSLSELRLHADAVNMHSVVVIGSLQSYWKGKLMVTPRGYRI